MSAFPPRVSTPAIVSTHLSATLPQDLFQSCLQHLSEPVVLFEMHADSPGFFVVFANEAFSQVTGYASTELIGNSLQVLNGPKTDPAFFPIAPTPKTGADSNSVRNILYRKNGEEVTVEWKVQPLPGKLGTSVHRIAVLKDLSHEMVFEENLRHAQKLEAVGLLTGGIVHDINNILTVVRGNADLALCSGSLPKECEGELNEIVQAVERAGNLTGQLLRFTRKQPAKYCETQMNDVVHGLVQLLRRLLGDDIEIDLNLDVSLPQIEADNGMLEQVLVNLAVNARDAMPYGGKIGITTDVVSLDATEASAHIHGYAGRFVRVIFTDTGVGISPENRDKIFLPFFTTKPAGKGTGLGLANVLSILRQHRGWIEIHSEVGAGTTFVLHFPIVTSKPPAQAISEQPVPSHRRKVLVAEDDSMVRSIVRALLQRDGFEVHDAADGKSALALWKEHKGDFELLVSDLIMPGGLNGPGLAAAIKAERPELPVLIFSGFLNRSDDVEWCRENSVTTLIKPFTLSDLSASIRKTMEIGCGLIPARG